MFGFGGSAQRFIECREQAKRARRRTVSRAEFIRLATAAGVDHALIHVKCAVVMGSSVLIGGELLKVRKAKKRKRG